MTISSYLSVVLSCEAVPIQLDLVGSFLIADVWLFFAAYSVGQEFHPGQLEPRAHSLQAVFPYLGQDGWSSPFCNPTTIPGNSPTSAHIQQIGVHAWGPPAADRETAATLRHIDTFDTAEFSLFACHPSGRKPHSAAEGAAEGAPPHSHRLPRVLILEIAHKQQRELHSSTVLLLSENVPASA